MKVGITHAILCLAALGVGAEANAAEKPHCQPVHGKIVWTLIPAPFDPNGRVLGTVTGTLHGSTTDTIRTIGFGPGGTLTTVDDPIFVTGENDVLITEAHATFTPIAGSDLVQDSQTITILGGSGKYEGATGVIRAEGVGHNLFTPQVGSTFFTLDYDGELCLAK